MATKKDCLELAACLRNSRPVKLKGYKFQQWLLDREHIVSYLAKDIAGFDAYTFRKLTEFPKFEEGNYVEVQIPL